MNQRDKIKIDKLHETNCETIEIIIKTMRCYHKHQIFKELYFLSMQILICLDSVYVVARRNNISHRFVSVSRI